MPNLANALVLVDLHRVSEEVQLPRDGAVGRAFGDQTDDREVGVGEAVRPNRVIAGQRLSLMKNLPAKGTGRIQRDPPSRRVR
jgi:hypothetical protein